VDGGVGRFGEDVTFEGGDRGRGGEVCSLGDGLFDFEICFTEARGRERLAFDAFSSSNSLLLPPPSLQCPGEKMASRLTHPNYSSPRNTILPAHYY